MKVEVNKMDTIVLDDNIEYIIVKEERIDNTLYTLFANINDNTDICFRKTTSDEEGNLYYSGLDDEKEFEKVSAYFAKVMLKEID